MQLQLQLPLPLHLLLFGDLAKLAKFAINSFDIPVDRVYIYDVAGMVLDRPP